MGGGTIITTCLNKYFLAVSLHIYQLCYLSGPHIQEDRFLASKLRIWGPFKKIEPKSWKIFSFDIYLGKIETIDGPLYLEAAEGNS